MDYLTELKQKLHALWEYLTNDRVWASERRWYIALAVLGALATGLCTYGSALWYLERTGVDYTTLCSLMIPWSLIMLFTDIFTVSEEDKVPLNKSFMKYIWTSIVVLYPILEWVFWAIVFVLILIAVIIDSSRFKLSPSVANTMLNDLQMRILLFETLSKLDKDTLPIVKPVDPSTIRIFPNKNGCRVKLSLSHKVQFDVEDLRFAQAVLQNNLEEVFCLWGGNPSACPLKIVQITQISHAVTLEIAFVTDNQSYQRYVERCNSNVNTATDDSICLWDTDEKD
jgi:hypothetical protein